MFLTFTLATLREEEAANEIPVQDEEDKAVFRPSFHMDTALLNEVLPALTSQSSMSSIDMEDAKAVEVEADVVIVDGSVIDVTGPGTEERAELVDGPLVEEHDGTRSCLLESGNEAGQQGQGEAVVAGIVGLQGDGLPSREK